MSPVGETRATRLEGSTGWVLAILALLTAAAPLSVDIYTPSLPLIQRDLGGDEWLTQSSITACLLGVGIGQLLWGPLSDRTGRRPVIFFGVLGWTITSLLSALAVTPVMLLSLRGLAGLCGAAGIVVARSVVRDISSDRRAVASRVGILSMVNAVAPVVAPVIGAVIAIAWGWRADFVALAAFGAAVGLAFALTVPETLPADRRTGGGARTIASSLAGGLRNRELAAVAIALGAHAFGFYAYITSASFIVERQFGHPPIVFALVFGTNAAAMLSANLVFRRLVRRRHPSLPLGIGLVACAVSGAVLFATAAVRGPEGVLWAASIVFAGGTGLVLPSAHSWGQLTVVASGVASALTGSAQFLGGVLGSPLTGLLGVTAENLGLVMTIASSVAIVAWVVARRAERAAHPGP
ncbi:Bcr/CflA family efflux MFS transporter [Subtercola sp. YIM 133946]|uniref:Bcr/CflA family efflux MFS transporter n=1 Tax=Subtercola sp. YIM 133946 TaxID=3118909 RepID=UPI002F91D034